MINNYAEQDNSIANYYKLYNIPILNVSKKKKKKKMDSRSMYPPFI